MRFAVVQPSQTVLPAKDAVLSGPCWVVDGDTIIINKVRIRLAGIDAPELDHPWGQQSKWALVKLCKGQTVTARLKPELSYDRVVAECFLPDGRDLAAELVRVGLALDWPKFSGGKYRHLEPADARRKLWRAQLRQRGLPEPPDRSPVSPIITRKPDTPYWASAPTPRSIPIDNVPRKTGFRAGWLIIPGLLAMLTVCFLMLGQTNQRPSARPAYQAPSVASFMVTSVALNVRAEPRAKSGIIGEIGQGMIVTPVRASGAWYSIVLGNGVAGWVHRDYLKQVTP